MNRNLATMCQTLNDYFPQSLQVSFLNTGQLNGFSVSTTMTSSTCSTFVLQEVAGDSQKEM